MAKTSDKIVEIPTTWTTGWTDIFNTGTWRSAVPVHQHRPAPCHKACPVNGEIPTWIQQLKNGEHREAWLSLTANNPFPAVIGRVCHHPCELECNRNEYDEKVSVKALERYLGDLALEKDWKLHIMNLSRKEKIAIVGAGPAGLSAAYQLRRRGFAVTVYEAQQKPGGLLYYGIPSYRLPQNILNGEIERLLQTGIELKTGALLTNPADFKKLKETYAAVFIATGAQHKPGLKDLDDKPEYLDGLKFLEQINTGIPAIPGPKVVVVGGGNTAVDAARSALRLGSREVIILYRREREQMPSSAEEILEAEEEGVKLELLAAPLALQRDGKKNTLLCQRTQLGEPDESGRQRPVVVEDETFAIELDTLIGATGTQADLAPLKGLLDLEGQADAGNGFFAGGDLISAERYVSCAISAGHLGAIEIYRYLGFEEDNREEENDPVAFKEINTFYFPSKPTLKKYKEPVETRTEDFREVEAGILLDQVVAESERCFSCGNCLYCDNCFYFCPDMAVQRDESLEEGYRVLDQYCKGCGLCAAECPRGAIVLKEELK